MEAIMGDRLYCFMSRVKFGRERACGTRLRGSASVEVERTFVKKRIGVWLANRNGKLATAEHCKDILAKFMNKKPHGKAGRRNAID